MTIGEATENLGYAGGINSWLRTLLADPEWRGPGVWGCIGGRAASVRRPVIAALGDAPGPFGRRAVWSAVALGGRAEPLGWRWLGRQCRAGGQREQRRKYKRRQGASDEAEGRAAGLGCEVHA